jgi:hypothetical protein
MQATLAQLIPDRTDEPAIIDESAAIEISQRSLVDRVERIADALHERAARPQPAVPPCFTRASGEFSW